MLKGVYSDITQLNSTDPVEQRTAKSVVFLFMTSRPTNWVNCCSRCERVDNSMSSWVESSWVELCRYKRALTLWRVRQVLVTSGLGGMSGAQAKAAVICRCVAVIAEVYTYCTSLVTKIISVYCHAIIRCACVCLSVCLSRSYILSKRIKISSKFFHHRVHTILVFPCRTA